MIRIKRVYSGKSNDDGYRILVDRMWPRGISKVEASIQLWLKDISPSDELRKWFSHDPEKWAEFERRYGRELEGKRELFKVIEKAEREHGTVTLLYAARDVEHNNALALVNYIKKQI